MVQADRSRGILFPVIAMCACVLAGLACQVDIGGPPAPGEPIPTQVGAGQSLINSWEASLANAGSGAQLLVLIDEVQLTSFLAQRMSESENPALRDPQVYLREDKLQIFGRYSLGPLTASVLLAVSPSLSPQGEISFELREAVFGPIPAPATIKDTVSAILTEAFTGSIGSLATGIRITSLVITDGEMAIVGELR